MKRIFEVDPWKVTTHKFSKEDKRLQESITAIGNDYMGMRGNFEALLELELLLMVKSLI